jgi:hypothetical protein
MFANSTLPNYEVHIAQVEVSSLPKLQSQHCPILKFTWLGPHSEVDNFTLLFCQIPMMRNLKLV